MENERRSARGRSAFRRQGRKNRNESDANPLGTVDPAFGPGDFNQDGTPRLAPRKKAREKVMDFLARRSYSEHELRQKLARTYEPDEIDDAVAFAYENNWMSPPEELSERVALELSRKNKGHRFINQFLKQKGLPSVEKDRDEEFRKALDLVDSKLAPRPRFDESENESEDEPMLDYEEKKKINQKIYRMLANRGFDDETIRRVLDERSLR